MLGRPVPADGQMKKEKSTGWEKRKRKAIETQGAPVTKSYYLGKGEVTWKLKTMGRVTVPKRPKQSNSTTLGAGEDFPHK